MNELLNPRERQLQIELDSITQLSTNAFMKRFEGSSNKAVISTMIENMVVEIESFHSEVVRKRASFFKITEGMEHEDVALIGLRVALHSLIVGNQTVVTVGSKIGRAISQKRTDSSDGVYYYKTAESEKENGAGGIKVLDLVLKSLPKGIMGYRLISETVNGKRKSTYTITQGTKFEEFMREHDDIFGMGASNKMPMVCLPDSWDSVYGGGFLSKKAKESCPLVKRLPKHDKPQGDTIFNSINHLQKTGYRVNQQMFSVYRELDKLKPLKLKKVFKEVKGDFEEVKPVFDAYDIWERTELTVTEEYTTKGGKEKTKEVVTKPYVHMTDEAKEARITFGLWRARKADHEEHETSRKSVMILWNNCLNLSTSLATEAAFYWPWSLDSRGRNYPSAMTGINLQGSDHQKAIVEFSEGLAIGSKGGVFALKKTLANHWGNDSGNGVKTDKLSRKQILQWVNKNAEWIYECAADPLTNTKWMEADKPFQFLAAAFDWLGWTDYSKENDDFGYISRLSSPNDASCSGAQILSALTLDTVGATFTNLFGGEVQDLYMEVAKKVQSNLQKAFTLEEMYQDWLGRDAIIIATKAVLSGGEHIFTEESVKIIKDFDERGLTAEEMFLELQPQLTLTEQLRFSLIIRNLVKTPVMVKFYAGTRYGNIEHVAEFIKKESWGEFFRGEPKKAAAFMGGLIYDSINQVVKGAGQVMEYFVESATVLGKLGIKPSVISGVGFKYTMSKVATETVRFKADFDGKNRRFNLEVDKFDEAGNEVLDVKKMASGIAPDLVHQSDGALISAVAEECANQGIDNLWLVHDSLAAPLCHDELLNTIIREQFVRLFGGDYLETIYEGFALQLEEAGHKRDLLKSPTEFGIVRGTFDINLVLESEFSFH